MIKYRINEFFNNFFNVFCSYINKYVSVIRKMVIIYEKK